MAFVLRLRKLLGLLYLYMMANEFAHLKDGLYFPVIFSMFYMNKVEIQFTFLSTPKYNCFS